MTSMIMARKALLGSLAAGALAAMAAPALAQDVYAAAGADGQPAASCRFGPVILCYVESDAYTAGVTADTDACVAGRAEAEITIEYAKLAMHSGLARIQLDEGPFTLAPLATATGADLVTSLDDVAYIISQERFGAAETGASDAAQALLTTRSVETTDLGPATVTRIRVGFCAEDAVIWSEAFMSGEVE